jgi:uncharacterized protein
MPMPNFQILSLDGGGMKGIFGAAVLAAIEEDLSTRVVEHFDLIAGTSTGGILALGLASGLRPRDLLDLYVKHQRDIFPRGRRPRLGLFRTRYGNTGLRRVLSDALGDRTFGSSPVRLVIPSYNLDANEVYVFRTPHNERLRRDWKTSMIDVALATSAAPTFLPSHRVSSICLVDGGVWANNPSMTALVEAVETCSIALDQIGMLSIGTTSELKPRSSQLDSGGLLNWAKPIVDVLMNGQSLAAKNHCSLLLPKGQFIRVDPLVVEESFQLDRVNAEALVSLARSASRAVMPQLAELFKHKPAPYQPLYPSKEPTHE